MRTTALLASLITNALAEAQARGTLPPSGKAGVVIEKPQHAEHGDYSCSLPLKLARAMQMSPAAIGQGILDHLADHEAVGSSWVAPPGFINFSLSVEWLQAQVEAIRAAGGRYGTTSDGSGERVQVEFVSVNPTGPLHVGHARGAVIGSGLANVLEAAGYDVQREYYVNDAGNQMRAFCESLYARYMQAAGHDVPFPEAGYQGDYLKEMAAELLEEEGDRFASMPRVDAVPELGRIGLEQTLGGIKTDLEALGVWYDEWFSEQTLLDEGDFDAAMSLLEKEGFLVDRGGARWFASTQLGEEKDNVVIRSGEGGPTYFGTDIAYHYNKLKRRGFDRVINVWGADHHGHVARMKAVAAALDEDPDRLTVILNQIVSFKSGEETARFSKREGVMVTLRDLVDEVGADACRFTFLSRSAESQMEFDLDLAKRQSSENPVYYVQYAHARLCSILRTAKERNLAFEDGDVGLLEHPREFELIRQLTALPEVVCTAAERLEPHHLAHYAMELARALQRYYEECRVVSGVAEDEAVSKARLKLADAARIVLERTLSLMGMSAPERM